ncbi:MAG TPA: heparan-alpha-glucosaminide N-acetyltransferase domain-containing protein [Gemmatimonadales bacterium]|nr:heparan-alpha-glucosaminide N-acetyltransferase domain-containing protein [Gemmatimonadales bacterium]
MDSSVAAPPVRQRLLSLDVFRGLTVAGMLLVNNPGTWSAIYPPLRHAQWHGWTPTDLIFPYFLFIVGITTVLSMDSRRARGHDDSELSRQVLRRGVIIFLLGLLLAWFPGYTWGEVAANPDPSFLDRVIDRLPRTRIPGVLQRIGLAYAVAGLLVIRLRPRQQLIAAAALLLGYWGAMTLIPVPDSGIMGWRTLDDPSGNLAAWLDRTLLDWGSLGNHLWASSRTWDPEGLLSTVPAIGTVLLGAQAGRWLNSSRPLDEKLNLLFAAGVLATVVGAMWGWVFPINKSLWTSSYTVFTAGMAAVTLATIIWMVDVRGWRGWTYPFVVYGVNPIVAFLGSGLMARLIYSVIRIDTETGSISLQAAIFRTIFEPLGSPRFASLLFAISFVALWFGILAVLHRRGIYLKV